MVVVRRNWLVRRRCGVRVFFPLGEVVLRFDIVNSASLPDSQVRSTAPTRSHDYSRPVHSIHQVGQYRPVPQLPRHVVVHRVFTIILTRGHVLVEVVVQLLHERFGFYSGR